MTLPHVNFWTTVSAIEIFTLTSYRMLQKRVLLASLMEEKSAGRTWDRQQPPQAVLPLRIGFLI